MGALEEVRQRLKEPWEDVPEGWTYGVVKCQKRGFGFAIERCSLKPVFFHKGDCKSPYAALKAGVAVKFYIADDPLKSGNPKAFQVQTINKKGDRLK